MTADDVRSARPSTSRPSTAVPPVVRRPRPAATGTSGGTVDIPLPRPRRPGPPTTTRVPRRRAGRTNAALAAAVLAVVAAGGCSGDGPEPGGAPATSATTPATTPPPATTSTPSASATSDVLTEEDLLVAVGPSPADAAATSSGSGRLPAEVTDTLVETAGDEVRLVVACSGGGEIEVGVVADEVPRSAPLTCEGAPLTSTLPAGEHDEVTVSISSAAEGHYAFRWSVG